VFGVLGCYAFFLQSRLPGEVRRRVVAAWRTRSSQAVVRPGCFAAACQHLCYTVRASWCPCCPCRPHLAL